MVDDALPLHLGRHPNAPDWLVSTALLWWHPVLLWLGRGLAANRSEIAVVLASDSWCQAFSKVGAAHRTPWAPIAGAAALELTPLPSGPHAAGHDPIVNRSDPGKLAVPHLVTWEYRREIAATYPIRICEPVLVFGPRP